MKRFPQALQHCVEIRCFQLELSGDARFPGAQRVNRGSYVVKDCESGINGAPFLLFAVAPGLDAAGAIA